MLPHEFTEQEANWVQRYFSFDIASFERALATKAFSFWKKEAEKRALRLFHKSAQYVPAYKHFLHTHRVAPNKIRTIEDFSKLPITTKQNYTNQYSLADRTYAGALHKQKLLASSSGTSGASTYWPRTGYQEYEAAITHDVLFRKLFSIHTKKTLCIVGFPMGVYVSGMATTLPTWLLSQKYNCTVATPGNNRMEVLRIIRDLGNSYEQIVLAGHPFFIKDVLETGTSEGMVWKKHSLHFIFASEGFSETWRQFVLQKSLHTSKEIISTSLYGSSELLISGFETPTSIELKRLLEKKQNLSSQITGTNQPVHIFQYNPIMRYIEHVHKELVFTADSGIPLIRYNLHDAGVTIPFLNAREILRSEKNMQATKTIRDWELPYIALLGRSDQTVVFYAANIYPEHIRTALQHHSILSATTGKFSLEKQYKRSMDEQLIIHVELTKPTKPSKGLTTHIQKLIIDTLKKVNKEYLFLWEHLDKDIRPIIQLWEYQHPEHFAPGIKPRYIKK